MDIEPTRKALVPVAERRLAGNKPQAVSIPVGMLTTAQTGSPILGRAITGVRRLSVWILPIAALAGCHVETQGLDEILSPAPTYANLPGRRLLSGQVSRIEVDVSSHLESPDVRVLVWKTSGELVIFDPLTMQHCSVGVVADFQSFTSTDLFEGQRSPRVAFIRAENEAKRGSLGFSDWNCNLWSTGLEQAELPNLQPRYTRYDYPVRATSQVGDALYVVDPWTKTTTLVTDGLMSLAFGGYGWFSREASNLVLRGSDLAFKFRWPLYPDVIAFGTGFVVLGLDGLVYLRSDAAGANTILARDACGPKGADPPDGDPLPWHLVNVGTAYGRLSFFAPCATRALQFYQPGNYATAGALRQIGDPGQFADPMVVYSYSALPSYVLDSPSELPQSLDGMVSRANPRYVGSLYGAVISREGTEPIAVEKIGERAILPSFYSVAFPWRRTADPLVLVDYDGTVGRLVVWHPGIGTEEIATSVKELEGGLAVVDWDGSSGALLIAMTDPPVLTTKRVASLSDFVYESVVDGAGVVAWVGPSGALEVIRGTSNDWNGLLGLHSEMVATNVQVGNYSWFGTNILGYLHDVDAGAGTLAIRFVDTGDVFEQTGVSDFQFVLKPLGVLYRVDQGSRAGVWFAALR